MSKAVFGFTLVELLVVIALVGLLGALALSRYGAAFAGVKAISCRENLRQWSLATQLYVQDNDSMLPHEGAPNGRSRRHGWYVNLPIYLDLPPYHEMGWRTNASLDPGRSLWICPANRRRSNGHNLFHYCLNGAADGRGDLDLPTQLFAFSDPGTIVWLFDNGGRAAVAQQNNAHPGLHKRGAHFTFLDGSVRHVPDEAFWNAARDRGRVDNPNLRWTP